MALSIFTFVIIRAHDVEAGAAFEIADLKAFAAGLPIGPGRRRTAGSASFERAAELGMPLATLSSLLRSAESLAAGNSDVGVRDRRKRLPLWTPMLARPGLKTRSIG